MRRLAALFLLTTLLMGQGLTISGTPGLSYVQIPNTLDCTGTGDATTILQAAINAMPDYSVMVFPIKCQVLLSSTISITNRSGVWLAANTNIRASANTNAATFWWNGSGSGPMFDVETSANIRFSGFNGQIKPGKTLNTFINSDGQGGSVVSTAITIDHNSLIGTQSNNSNYKAMSLAATASSNNENALIYNNFISCSGPSATLRARDGVTNGTTTLTSATAAFVSGDAGSRIRLSYSGGILDTTIASYTNSTTVVLSAAPSFSQSGVTIITGQAYGTGIYQGADGNQDKNMVYNSNQISDCQYAFDIEGGDFHIDNISGGSNDIGVYVNGSAQTSVVRNEQSEGNVQELYVTNNGGAGTILYEQSRMNNTNGTAYGLYEFVGGGRLTFLANNSNLTAVSNSVLFAFGGVPTTPTIFSAGNNFAPLTLAEINYNATAYLEAVGDARSGTPGYGMFIGLPTSCSGQPTGTKALISNVLNVCP